MKVALERERLVQLCGGKSLKKEVEEAAGYSDVSGVGQSGWRLYEEQEGGDGKQVMKENVSEEKQQQQQQQHQKTAQQCSITMAQALAAVAHTYVLLHLGNNRIHSRHDMMLLMRPTLCCVDVSLLDYFVWRCEAMRGRRLGFIPLILLAAGGATLRRP